MKRTALIFFIVLFTAINGRYGQWREHRFTAAVAMPGWSCNRNRSSQRSRAAVGWVVKNRHHTQRLGGKSLTAWKGLRRAAAQSQSVEPADKTKDTGDKTLGGGTTVTK